MSNEVKLSKHVHTHFEHIPIKQNTFESDIFLYEKNEILQIVQKQIQTVQCIYCLI